MKYLLFFLLLLSLSVDATPIGTWELMEPDSEDVKSTITITSVPKDSDRYLGVVTRIYHKEIPDELPLCRRCTGDLKNKPIIGMRVVKELQQKEGAWVAKILNTDNGYWYEVMMEINGKNDQLMLSQTWWNRLFQQYNGSQWLGHSMDWRRKK
jgi:hypothetical protein